MRETHQLNRVYREAHLFLQYFAQGNAQNQELLAHEQEFFMARAAGGARRC